MDSEGKYIDSDMDSESETREDENIYTLYENLDKREVERKFDTFVQKRKMRKDETTDTYPKEATHVCFGKPYGAYHISDEDYNTFINLYKRVLYFRNDDMHFIEKQKLVGPLLIDLDFRQDKKYKDRKYLDKHIYNITSYIVDLINTYFSVAKSNIEALVFEKEEPTFDEKKSNYKDGFHIIFPIPFHVTARAFITDEFKKKVKENKTLEDIPYVNEKGIDEIIDTSVVWRNGWCMYGSRKETGKLYSLTQIYDGFLNIKKLEEYDDSELVSLLAIRQYNEEDQVNMRKKYDTPDMKVKMQEYYDEIVNKKYKKKTTESAVNNVDDKINDMKIRTEHILKPKKASSDDVRIAKELIPLLADIRASNYENWIRVCWALKNIGECMYGDFIKFSKRCKDKFDEKYCEKVWNQAHYNFSLASICWWAKTDNPNGYQEFMRRNISDLIKEAETGTHDDLAKVMYEMYKHTYKCVSIKKNIWYEFQGHKWVQIDSAWTLANKLSDELTAEFAQVTGLFFISAGSEKKAGSGDSADKTFYRGKRFISIIEKLKNESFKNQVIASCARRFIDSKFEEKLDDNRDLIGFENGVFDLRPECFGFRHGVPEDYICMTTGYDYNQYSDKDDQIKEILEYFKTVQQEEDMREYVLTLIASFLDGHNRHQKFILCTGSGCHAKGTNILMYNGSIKKVEDINLGEEIMGDDCRPRRVKNLFTGREDMYTIVLDNGDKFTVNSNHRLAVRNHYNINISEGKDIYENDCHILSWYEYIKGDDIPVKVTKSFIKYQDAEIFREEIIKENPNYINYGEIIPVKVIDFINLDKEIQNNFKMFSNKVEFDKEFGVISRTNAYEYIMEKGITKNDKFINCKLEKRLEYVAGLIDKYGSYDKINNRYLLPIDIFYTEGVEYIIRTTGLRIDFDIDEKRNIGISGHLCQEMNLIKLPKLIPEKEIYKFDYTMTKIVNVGKDNFYGFELDGNRRYMMANTMITYNSNGKSTTIDLVQYAMGDYFGILPTTVITVKHKNSSGARPELANKKGKRFLVIQEPEHDDQVYVGQMKNLTGADWIETRALYGEPFKFKPQFKLILVCNKLPFIPANDGGTWRRLRVIPWESEFVDKPDPKNSKQFLKDPELMEKLKDWKQPFIWILLNKYYLKYRKMGMTEPKKVTQFTDKFKKDSDIYYEFMKDTYVVTGDNKDYDTLVSLYNSFKEWYKGQHGGGQNVPTRKDVTNYIQSMDSKIKIINGNVRGIKSLLEVDEDDLGVETKGSKVEKTESKIANDRV
jgi:P4 family phage/plasmid primase-like protien